MVEAGIFREGNRFGHAIDESGVEGGFSCEGLGALAYLFGKVMSGDELIVKGVGHRRLTLV